MQKIKNKVILISLFIFLICAVSFAQETKLNSMGQALTVFINSPKVINNFREWSHKQDSLLLIVDLCDVLKGYSIVEWRGLKIAVLKEGGLVDSLKLFDANYLVGKRCNIYVLMSRNESKNVTFITLRHACTNVVSSVKITEKKHLFYLGKIENAVW